MMHASSSPIFRALTPGTLPLHLGGPSWTFLNDGPGKRLFKTGEEVDDYVADERASWDR